MEQDGKSSFKIDVPQVALLNCSKFEVVNKPEVTLLNTKGNSLCRWTCEYNAALHQKKMKVNEFPYDEQKLLNATSVSPTMAV